MVSPAKLILAFTVLLSGCIAKTELPVVTEEVGIPGSLPQVVCRMRMAAQHTGASFHFGHNQANDVMAFRIIGTRYEVEAVNWAGKAVYEFRLYVPSRDRSTIGAARKALMLLIQAVSTGNPACR